MKRVRYGSMDYSIRDDITSCPNVRNTVILFKIRVICAYVMLHAVINVKFSFDIVIQMMYCQNG